MNYSEIAGRIKSLEGTEVIGQVGSAKEKYNLYKIVSGKGQKVLLSGAVHGDEPAGIYTILEFLQQHAHEFLDQIQFTSFPCINPWGFQNNKRGNSDGLNINREFKANTKAEEVRLIVPHLERYLLTIDLHETWPDASRVGDKEPEGKDPNDFYLWEICRKRNIRVGNEIANRVREAGIRVCDWPKIYGDTNDNGVIWYPENCGTECYADGSSFDAYLEKGHTEQAFTIETPLNSNLEERIQAGIISIKTAIKERLKLQ